MKDSRHFVTGEFKPPAAFLSDEDYSKMLDSMVIACIDCILLNRKGEMLLGKRKSEPLKD